MIEKAMSIALARTAGVASAGFRGARAIRLLCVSCVMCCAAACSDPMVPPTPTPAVPSILDTFTGTLLQFGTNSHPFSVQQIGGIKISVTSIDPSAAIGIGIGTPSTASGSCLVLTQVTTVSSAGVQISGNATLTGNFCVSVSDVGNLVEPVNYTITVLHT